VTERERPDTTTLEPPSRRRRVPAAALTVAAALGVILVLLLAGAGGGGASVAPEGSAAAERTRVQARLERSLERLLRAHRSFPGAALAVKTQRGAWAAAAGVANRASRKPLAPDATFRIASVTKTFTAAAILRLVERGRLALEDPISRHLSPATVALLQDGGYDVNAIRVSHLLQHTGGLAGDYAELPAYVEFILSHPRHRWTRAEQVRFVIDRTRPLAPPGAEEHYSDTGYILLGEILERVTGRRLAAAYRSLLRFKRLGLDETYLETRERKPAVAKPRAHQYIGNIDTTRFNPSFDLHGAGGHVSTLDDLVRYYRALLGGRVFKRAATLRTMLANEMGIDRTPIGDEICYGHGGFWGVAAYHCPRSDLTIAGMINQGLHRPHLEAARGRAPTRQAWMGRGGGSRH
jgi:D-alanyl-D-alanine carboxypeptidase